LAVWLKSGSLIPGSLRWKGFNPAAELAMSLEAWGSWTALATTKHRDGGRPIYTRTVHVLSCWH